MARSPARGGGCPTLWAKDGLTGGLTSITQMLFAVLTAVEIVPATKLSSVHDLIRPANARHQPRASAATRC